METHKLLNISSLVIHPLKSKKLRRLLILTKTAVLDAGAYKLKTAVLNISALVIWYHLKNRGPKKASVNIS
jgi:hypothetical protein